jgi:biopolymer transport protein ExbB
MYPLFVCAVVSFATALDRLWAIVIATRRNETLIKSARDLLLKGDIDGALSLCADTPGPISSMIASGVKARNLAAADVERAMQEMAMKQLPLLSERLSVLDTVITLAPLLGLLGTVTGMIRAFHVVASMNSLGTPTAITGGVSEALIATAAGLTIAVTTLPVYNFLTERVKGDIGAMELHAAEVLNILATRAPGQPDEKPVSRRARFKTAPVQFKRARIEIIPMIDTIFFLLVFFMITSLAMQPMAAPKVHLPTSASATDRPQNKVIVTVTATGDYYVDRQKVSETDIRALIQAKVQQDPGVTVILNCDKDQHIAQFVRAFDLVKQSNAATVMIATTPEAPGGNP